MNQLFKRIAAIDIGTNSFHAVIVEVAPDGSYTTLDTYKEMVGLGADVSRNFIGPQTMETAVQSMKNIKLLCDHQGVEIILAYATSAIRESNNGGDFIQRVLDETGIKIQAIPGKKEAELIAFAVQHSINLSDEPVLIMDVGGGSVEFIICNRSSIFFLESLKIGVSRTAATFIKNDPISKSEINDIVEFFNTQLSSVFAAVKELKPTMLIGSSGTMENIANMISVKQSDAPTFSLNQFQYSKKEVDKLAKDFLTLQRNERSNFAGLDTKRVDFIIPGIILTQYVLEKTGLELVTTSSYALREGMIIDYIKTNSSQFSILSEYPDVRERSIFQLLKKCNWHKNHSSHVAKLALKIFDDLAEHHSITDQDRELLRFACLLHDIGYHISHNAHHKHALYIIENADLKGFSQEEIYIMAHVSRYHRLSTPKKRHDEYHALPKDIRKRIKILSGFIRVADGLDRSHFQTVNQLDAQLTDSTVLIKIHSESDPQVEIWGALRKSELFEEFFKRKLVIEAV